MAQAAFLIVGLALLALMLAEFVTTTIGATVRRMLTHGWARLVFRALAQVSGRSAPALLHQTSGPIVMSAVALLWIAWLSTAWTFVFMADPSAVVHASTGERAEAAGIWGHVGHLLSTLGSGATEPGNLLWYIVGVLVAVSGMVVLTLSVSFILTTTSTVASGRALCGLLKSYDPADPEARDVLLPKLAEVTASLNAAPFALYYSSPDAALRLPRQLARTAERAAAGPEFSRWRRVLEDLPGIEAERSEDDAAFLDRMGRWAERVSLNGEAYSPAKAQSA